MSINMYIFYITQRCVSLGNYYRYNNMITTLLEVEYYSFHKLNIENVQMVVTLLIFKFFFPWNNVVINEIEFGEIYQSQEKWETTRAATFQKSKSIQVTTIYLQRSCESSVSLTNTNQFIVLLTWSLRDIRIKPVFLCKLYSFLINRETVFELEWILWCLTTWF